MRGRSYLALFLALIFAGGGLALMPITSRLSALAADMVPGGEAIYVAAAPVPLKPNDRMVTKAGKLRYMGGLYITSTDRRFGGWSGLLVSADGKRLLSISDRSYWLDAHLLYAGGRLSGISGATLAPVLGSNGKPLKAPYYDSESLTALAPGFPLDDPNGAVDIGFETKDRVDRYPIGRDGFLAKPIPEMMPDAIKNNVDNKGLEGIARLPDGRLLAITERTLDAAGNMVGWIVSSAAVGGGSVPLSLKRNAPYDLSDLSVGPDGNIYALERRYSRVGGPGMRVRRIPKDTVKADAILDGEVLVDLDQDYSIDNMEGLSMRKSDDGQTLLYVISDDNYSAAERTLLLMFALEE